MNADHLLMLLCAPLGRCARDKVDGLRRLPPSSPPPCPNLYSTSHRRLPEAVNQDLLDDLVRRAGGDRARAEAWLSEMVR